MKIYRINSYSDSSIKQTQSYSKQSQPNFCSKYDDGPAIMATCAAVGAIGCLLTTIQTCINESQKSVKQQQEEVIITQDSLHQDSHTKTADFKVEQAAQKNTDNDISMDSLSMVSEGSSITTAKDTIERIPYNTSLPKPKEMKPFMEKFFDSVGFPYRKIEINKNGDIEINQSRLASNRILLKSDKANLYGTNRGRFFSDYYYTHKRIDGLMDIAYGYLDREEYPFDMRDKYYRQGFKIYDPKYKKYYTNEYQIFDNYRKRVNVNLNSIDYFNDFNKYMLSSILANYGIYDITDFQLQDNKAVLTCNSIHNTTYKIEFIKNNNEVRGLITDNKSKKMFAFIYNDETSGENNIVNLSTQKITNPNYNIEQIASENMTKHINYAINKEFYGNDNLYKDGEPTISNGNDFERADNCIRVYRFVTKYYKDPTQFTQFSQLFQDKTGKPKEPGSCMFYNIFGTDEEKTNPQIQTGCNNNTCSHRK